MLVSGHKTDTNDLFSVASALVDAASKKGLSVASAESCTAGMVAAAIADVPGASAVLRGGAVTYCDEVKAHVLGVRPETLSRYTAVSSQTATEMAKGARALFKANVAVSLTGYAGPGGGTQKDPAGTVYIGLASDAGTDVLRCSFSGSRNEVRRQAAVQALQMLLNACR